MRRSKKAMALVAAGAAMIVSACGVGVGSDADDSAPRFTVGEAQVRMGGIDDPDYAFGFVRAGAVGRDGRLYTLHANDAFVRRWTPDGRPDGQIGRAGEGPGEFSAPGALGFFGDSLWVMDVRSYTASYFDQDGVYLGRDRPAVDFGTRGVAPSNQPPRPRRPIRGGAWMAQTPAGAHDMATGALETVTTFRVAVDGTVLDTVHAVSVRGTDLLALIREDGQGGWYGQQPFTDRTLELPSGEAMFVVDRRVWTGAGPSDFRILRVAWDGDTLWHHAIPYRADPLEGTRVDSVAADMAGQLIGSMSATRPGLSVADLEQRLSDALYAPHYLPPIRTAFVAADETVWLQRFDPVDGHDVWWVVGASGLHRAIHLPAGFRPLWSDGVTLWGVETDDLDVNFIVRYRIEPMAET